MLETTDHLFFECSFAKQVWNFIKQRWRPGEMVQLDDTKTKNIALEIYSLGCGICFVGHMEGAKCHGGRQLMQE